MNEPLKGMTALRSFEALKKLIKHKTRISAQVPTSYDLDSVIDMLDEAVRLGLRPKKRKR